MSTHTQTKSEIIHAENFLLICAHERRQDEIYYHLKLMCRRITTLVSN